MARRGSSARQGASWARSTSRLLALVTILGGLLGVTGGGLVLGTATATVAAADPIADCSTTTGVIVVVDFSYWGGDAQRGCAADPVTGYDALQEAGFTTAGDEHDGPAFICRIDDEPPPSEDPCVDTPPPSAYWSYWHADQGQTSWTYSQQGAMSYEPPPGSVEAWEFGAGDPPAFPPSAVMATNVGPTASTTTVPTTSPAGSGGSSSGTGAGAGSPTAGSSTASSTPGPGASPGAASSPASTGSQDSSGSSGASGSPQSTTTTHPTSVPSTTPTSSGTGEPGPGGGPGTANRSGEDGDSPKSVPKIVDISPSAVQEPAAGSPLPFLLGALAVVAAAGTASAVVWWRRRAERTDG